MHLGLLLSVPFVVLFVLLCPAQGALSDDAVWRLTLSVWRLTSVAYIRSAGGVWGRPAGWRVLADQARLGRPGSRLPLRASVAGMGGGISWRPSAYSLLLLLSSTFGFCLTSLFSENYCHTGLGPLKEHVYLCRLPEQVFRGQMPLLTPIEQCRSTDGKLHLLREMVTRKWYHFVKLEDNVQRYIIVCIISNT